MNFCVTIYDAAATLQQVWNELKAMNSLKVGLWCLASLSTIFQLYRGGSVLLAEKPDPPEKTTDLSRHWQTLSHKEFIENY